MDARPSRWSALVLMVTLVPFAACGGGDDSEMEDDIAVEAPAAAPAPAADQPMTVMLTAKNASGVTGEATAEHGMDSATVTVRISGATQDGNFPAHVHSGHCASPGGVLAPLTALTVTGGTGSSTSTVALAKVPEGEPALIQVHDPSGQPVACGDLAGYGDMGPAGAGDTTGR